MITKRIVLQFPQKLAEQPVVYRLVKEFDLEFNILKASISPEKGGRLMLELSGDDTQYESGIEFIRETGIEVKPLSQEIIRDDETCVHCGVCVPVCPTETLRVNTQSQVVEFDNSKCIACGLCVKICPYHAVELKF